MKAKLVNKKVQMQLDDIIRFQLMTYCFINDINISDSELNCLLLLCLNGKCDLSEFTKAACDPKSITDESQLEYQAIIFKTPQTVRNFIRKAGEIGLVYKEGSSRKKIYVNPEMNIQTSGNIVLDFKFFRLEPQESERVHRADSGEATV